MSGQTEISCIISVTLLCFVNVIHFMDRFTVSGVLIEITNDFNLKYWQCGLLQTSFLLVYCVFAPIFGYFGDRYSRKSIMMFGIFQWGFFNLIGSFMPEYWSFMACRAVIGIGEAGYSTIAPTVIGDLFGGNLRTAILAIFYFAIPVGSGLGYIVGDKVGQLAENWRWGMRVTPFLNLMALILMHFFLLDPKRGQKEKVPTQSVSTTSFSEDFIYLCKNKSYLLVSAAFTFLTFATGSLTWWGPFLMEDALEIRKEYGMDVSSDPAPENISFFFGIVMVVSGILGLISGSGLSFTLRRHIARIDPIICGVGLLLSAPFLYAAIRFCLDGINMAYVLIFVGETFLNMNWAIVVDISMYVVVPTVRSGAEAIQLTVAHMLGEAGSPYLLGLIADYIKEAKENNTSLNPTVPPGTPMTELETSFYSLQTTIYITTIFCLMSSIAFFLTSLYVVNDKKNAERKMDENRNVKADSIT